MEFQFDAHAAGKHEWKLEAETPELKEYSCAFGAAKQVANEPNFLLITIMEPKDLSEVTARCWSCKGDLFLCVKCKENARLRGGKWNCHGCCGCREPKDPVALREEELAHAARR